jgi:hypothetical protein
VLRFFRDLMAEAPDSLQATLNLTASEHGVFVSLCHAGETAEAERLLRSFRTVATPAKDTVRRQEFADLAGRSPVVPDVSFNCIATTYRKEWSDEIIDMTLDRLAEAPAETPLGITHYMHGEVCRVSPESTAFPLRQSGGVHIRIGAAWHNPAASERLVRWANQARQLGGLSAYLWGSVIANGVITAASRKLR